MVVFRLGKMIGAKGPGRILIFPWLDRCIKVKDIIKKDGIDGTEKNTLSFNDVYDYNNDCTKLIVLQG